MPLTFTITGEFRPFLWSPDASGGESMSDLAGQLAGGWPAAGRALNDAGQILVNKGGDHTSVWTPNGFGSGAVRNIDDSPGGGTISEASSTNSAGQVVGISVNAHESPPFVWDLTIGMLKLSDLVDAPADGWELIDARAINDAGQIVVAATNPEDVVHALVLTPTNPRMCRNLARSPFWPLASLFRF